jgi:hypothetical protein
MTFLSESLTIGLLLTLVFGALFFYVYSRVSYVEKRVGLIENILIDIKMNQEQQPINILPHVPPSMTFRNVSTGSSQPTYEFEILEKQPSDEEIYTNVLEEAHSNTDLSNSEVTELSGNDVSGYEPLTETLSESLPKLSVNYEAMTKEELTEIAKKKGIRISNRPGREKLLQLIKSSEDMNNEVSL